MEKRIELEKRGRPEAEITDLNLDNCRATQIEGLSDNLVNLESLSLINVGLTTLKGFPNLPNLRKLELSDNRISGSLNLMNGCTKLSYLNLSGNKIKDIDTLEPLKNFSELRNLDLFNCEVTSQESYRERVFELLPSLQYLDGYDRDDHEADEDDDDVEDIDGDDDDDEEGDDDEDEDEDGDDVVDLDDDDDDDDVDDDDDDDDDDGDDDEDGVGLEYLQKEDLDGDEDGEDFDPPEADDDDDDDLGDDDDDDDDDDAARGVKRKHDGEEEDA